MSFDADSLVARLNELANNAQEPSYTFTRAPGDVGHPMTDAEFATVSGNVAWLSANRYIADPLAPDSYVNYVSPGATVNTPRLRALDQAMRRMRWIRRYISWTDGAHDTVTVTHASWSEALANDAMDLIDSFWALATSTTSGDFAVTATHGTTSTASYYYKIERKGDGSLEVKAEIGNAVPTFDFTSYADASEARVMIKSKCAEPFGTAADIQRPQRTYHDVLYDEVLETTGYKQWVTRDTITDFSSPSYAGDALPGVSTPDSLPISYPTADGVKYVKSWAIDSICVLIYFEPTVLGAED